MYDNLAYDIEKFEYTPEESYTTVLPGIKIEENEPEGEKLIGVGVKFERIRRITGYLVGTLDRFNNAKYAEVNDRVKHALSTGDAMGLERI